MNIAAGLGKLAEAIDWPDPILRAGIERLVARTRKSLASATPADEANFANWMREQPIASDTHEANRQHYEVPARFFELVLGPRRKYSCCYFENDSASLAEAEEAALARTSDHAALADGQRILELGCGWGSLSLWMAQQYPHASITAVSNSHSQRRSIEDRAASKGLANLTVITCDMNEFQSQDRFDRIVSVEMFEHMRNWESLLARAHGWLDPAGSMFIHVFSHRLGAYAFDVTDPADWIAQHFFTGGIMPSHHLIRRFDKHFTIDADWTWSGEHYQKTADRWLSNFDANREEIDQLMLETYGEDANLWRRRWRLFFLATSGLFGHAGGAEWGVSHYRLKPNKI